MTSQLAARREAAHQRERRLVDAHFGGRISPRGERELRTHLVECADCRHYYEHHLHLAAVDPAPALPSYERLARGLGLPRHRLGMSRLHRSVSIAAAVGVLASVALILWQGAQRADFEPRGASSGPGSQLLVYEVPRAAAPRPAITEMQADSALAFAYTNIGHKARLMVFAVDENRKVYWYHPAWRSAEDEPVAIEIERDDAVHEIPQAISHAFSGRCLQVFGVFTDQALSVRDMETSIARAPSDGRRGIKLALDGADTRLFLLTLRSGP